MATIIVGGDSGTGGGHAANPDAGWIILGALTGLALLAFTTPLGAEAEVSYWYELGAALPAQRQTAITHLQALEKGATASVLALIQKDVAALQALGTGTTTKGG